MVFRWCQQSWDRFFSRNEATSDIPHDVENSSFSLDLEPELCDTLNCSWTFRNWEKHLHSSLDPVVKRNNPPSQFSKLVSMWNMVRKPLWYMMFSREIHEDDITTASNVGFTVCRKKECAIYPRILDSHGVVMDEEGKGRCSRRGSFAFLGLKTTYHIAAIYSAS